MVELFKFRTEQFRNNKDNFYIDYGDDDDDDDDDDELMMMMMQAGRICVDLNADETGFSDRNIMTHLGLIAYDLVLILG